MAESWHYELLSCDVGLNDLQWGESQHLNLGGDEQTTPPVRSNLKRSKNFTVLEGNVLVDAYLEIIRIQPRGTNSLVLVIGRGSLITSTPTRKKSRIVLKEEDKGNKSFGLMHCYEKLEKAEKWTSRLSHKKQKKTSDATPGSSTPSTNASVFEDEATSPSKDVPRTRPIGKKAAKELLRRGKGSTSTGGSTVMEAFSGLLSARDVKRQERFDLAIAVEQEMEEVRLVGRKEKTRIRRKESGITGRKGTTQENGGRTPNNEHGH